MDHIHVLLHRRQDPVPGTVDGDPRLETPVVSLFKDPQRDRITQGLICQMTAEIQYFNQPKTPNS